MIQYNLTYQTNNNYETLVNGGYYKFLIHPYLSKQIRIGQPQLTSSVEGDWWITKGLCDEIQEIHFKTTHQYQKIEIKFEIQVELEETNPFDYLSESIESEEEIMRSSEWIINNYAYTHINPNRLKSYLEIENARSFQWKQEGNLIDKVIDLRDQVHQYIKFDTTATNTETCALDVLHLQKGVCQDFTHLLLGLLRLFGVPARYVSGYIHQGKGYKGASQLHAWVECNIPKMGWIGVDPTNQLMVDAQFVKICHGYDYDDCLPVAGVVNTNSKNQTSTYQVIIQQTQ